MEIINSQLRQNEIAWFERIFQENFPQREILVAQLNHAKISREYTEYYISLLFQIQGTAVHFETDKRVPIEMRAYGTNKGPVQFLVHIIGGFLSELEVFNADSTPIDGTIDISNMETEVMIGDTGRDTQDTGTENLSQTC